MVRISAEEAIVDDIYVKDAIVDDIPIDNDDNFEGGGAIRV